LNFNKDNEKAAKERCLQANQNDGPVTSKRATFVFDRARKRKNGSVKKIEQLS